MRSLYLGLLRNGKELRGKGYERVSLADVSWVLSSSGGGQFLNKTYIKFPVAKESWGVVNSAGIFTAKTRGKRLKTIPLDYEVKVPKGWDAGFRRGHLEVTIIW